MKHFIRLTLISIFFITCTYSCTKKDGGNGAKSSREILIAGQWKKSEFRENGVVTPFYGECEMDDIITFSTNGNYTLNTSGTECTYYTGASSDFFIIESDNKTMRWGLHGTGEISFNSTYTAFTFKNTGANTFEWTFVKR